MVIGSVFGVNSATKSDTSVLSTFSRLFTLFSRQIGRLWCGMHGHVMLLHFEPNKLSLQCGLCGYESEGWEVGRPMTARRQVNNPQARPDRRRAVRPLPSRARLAS